MSTFNQQFPRNLKGDVATKTTDGRSYKDIEQELILPLPAGDHEIKKLGYDKTLGCDMHYVFLPWGKMRDRLRGLVGSSGFRFEITGITVTNDGDPMFIGVMNILGIEHQGIGYGRAQGGYKGGKEEIAYADCFKNALEQHGMGSYINDQEFVAQWLIDSGNAKAIALGRQLANQFMRKNKSNGLYETSRKLKTSTPKPSPTPSAQQGLYPQHNGIVKKFRTYMDISADDVLKKTEGLTPSAIAPDRLLEIIKELVAEYAFKQGTFNSKDAANAALKGVLAIAAASGQPPCDALMSWLREHCPQD